MLRPSTIIPCLFAALMLGPTTFCAADAAGTFIARSFDPAVSEAEAVESARRDAAESLLPRLRDVVELRLRERMSRSHGPMAMPSDQVLRSILRAELAGDAMIRGREVQRQAKSYGDVYSAALTIDANTRALDRMAERALSVSRASAKRSMIATVGTGALLAGIVVIYLVANSLTRGYYLWRLRMLAAVAAVATVGVGTVLGRGFGV